MNPVMVNQRRRPANVNSPRDAEVANKEALASRAEVLTHGNKAAVAKRLHRKEAQYHVSYAKNDAAAQHLQSSAWQPIMHRDAAVPMLLLAGHYVCMYLIRKNEEALSGVFQETFTKGVAAAGVYAGVTSSIFSYTAQWGIAEACRIVATPYLRKWQHSAATKCQQKAIELNSDDVQSWAVPQVRDSIAAGISSEARTATYDAIEHVYGTLSNVMNLAAFAAATPQIFTPVTLCGTLIGAALLFSVSARQQELSTKEKKAALRLQEIGASFADNKQLGNEYNMRLWQQQKTAAEADYEKASRERLTLNMKVEMTLIGLNGVAATVPFYLKVRDKFSTKQFDDVFRKLPGNMKAMNAVAHRSVEFAKDANALVKSWGTLEQVKISVARRDEANWQSRVASMLANSDGFTIKGPAKQSVTISELLRNPEVLAKPGRWTVRARNGAGKSTLLNALKMKLGAKVHYVPVKHSLAYQAKQGSAGQTQLRQLAEVIRNVNAPILFLDEWPANLDVPNGRAMHNILQDLSKERCVVEVRNDEEHHDFDHLTAEQMRALTQGKGWFSSLKTYLPTRTATLQFA